MPKILLLLISILLLPSGITRANVFGTDDRQELGGWLGDPQWFAVGRITYDGGYCTATLVGRNLIVTAKHCAFEYDGRWKTNLKFWPYTMHTWYRMGVSIRSAWKDDNHSWVLLSLTQPLGDYITPWLVDAYSTDNDESFGLRVSLFGYADDISNGQKLFMTMNCQFEFVRSPGVFGHYCDDYLGSAGAPIVRDNYDGFRIVAIATGFSGANR